MIRYALGCDRGHSFESWFRDSDAFERQAAAGEVACPFCHSARVSKQIMAPAVSGTHEPYDRRPVDVVALGEREKAFREMIRTLHAHVVANTEDVGARFPNEIRRMHYGEAEERAIRGKADAEEARALIEEGIDILPLPSLPDERN